MNEINRDIRCYVTNAGLKAEREALANGTELKITSMVIDAGLLPDNQDPKSLTSVLSAADAPYPVMVKNDDSLGALTIIGDIPSSAGTFEINGFGWITNTGVLYAYARGMGDVKRPAEAGQNDVLRIETEIKTENASVVAHTYDDSQIYTTHFELNEVMQVHLANDNPHPQYMHNDEHATQEEAEAGWAQGKWMSPFRVRQWWVKALTQAWNISGSWSFSSGFKVKSGTASSPTLELEGERSDLANPIGAIRFMNRVGETVFDLMSNGHGKLMWRGFGVFHEGYRNLSDSTNSESSLIGASSKAVYDAYQLATTKMTQWQCDQRYLPIESKVSLTTNDGHGNANLVFNHRSGVPLQDGSAYRLQTYTDNDIALATFALSDAVKQGVTPTLTEVWAAKLSLFDVKVDLLERGKRVYSPNNQPKASDVVGAQLSPYDPNRTYYTGETCTTTVNGVVHQWEAYHDKPFVGKNPNEEANRQVGWTDDTQPWYWSPLKKARAGTPLFPWMSMTFPEGTLNVVGNSVPTAVFWRLAEALPEFVNATTGMIDFPETGSEFFRVLDQGRGIDLNRAFGTSQESSIVNIGDSSKSGIVASTFYNNVDDNSETLHGNLNSDGIADMTGVGRSYTNTSVSNVGNADGTGMYIRPRNLAFPILVEV